MTDTGANELRKTTGTSSLERTARDAIAVLADHGIAHLIIGGLAVQEHGYYRVTVDVDLVVPDVFDAVEILTANLSGPFGRVPGRQDAVRDNRTGALIDFLPAGRVVKAGCQVPLPEPRSVADQPQVVTLEQLISLKLDSWASSPAHRLRDKADVVELILRRHLPRNLSVHPAVRRLYEETWDAVEAEK
jgi:hypothetical protein